MPNPLVLIVDDHQLMRETLVRAFSFEPVDTITAGNGREALVLIRRRRPDLVILDFEMPGGMSGLDVLKIIRSDPELAKTRVMLHTLEKHLEIPDEIAPDDYLIKPADFTKLFDSVYRLLG